MKYRKGDGNLGSDCKNFMRSNEKLIVKHGIMNHGIKLI